MFKSKLVFSLIILIFICANIFAGVIKVIPSPDYPYGLTFDGQYLWVGCSHTNSADVLWQVDTADGSVVNTIPVPNNVGTYYIKGLTFDGQYLWIFEDLPSSSHPDKFYQVDPVSGTVLDSFNSPENNYIGGMTWVDPDIWFSFYYPLDGLIKVDTSGNPLDSIITQGEQPMGVAYDGQYLWCAEDTGFGASKQEIYQYDPVNGNYTGTFIRNPTASPRDMTWDGQYFWIIGYSERLIYKFSTTGGTPHIVLSDTLIDFQEVVIGDTYSLAIQVANQGTDTLTVDSLSFNQAVFYSDSVNFPIMVEASGNFTLPVSFAPVNYGAVTGIMTIYSNDPLNLISEVDLTGTGLYGDTSLICDPASIDFGSVWIGQDGSTARILKLINSGGSAISIDSIQLQSAVFSFESPSMPFSINPNETLLTRVWFDPVDPVSYSDTLNIFGNNLLLNTVPLAGEGFSDTFDIGYQFWHYQTPDNPFGSNYDKKVEGLRAMGDVNGDGVKDVVISTENYLTICLNGASSGYADTFWVFNTGVDNNNTGSISLNGMTSAQKAIQIASDLNGDGISDVVIATDGGNEHVYALNGLTGEELWSFGDDYDPYLGGFGAVDVRRDFDNDSTPDVLAVASSNSTGGGHKSVYCFNGVDGTIIWQYPITVGGLASGYSVISTSDVTGDSVPDCVAGYGGDGVTQFARGINGATGAMIWEFTGPVNGAKELLELPITDSTPDVIVADYWGDMWRVDGETGSPIWHADVNGAVIQMNLIRDINGNGYDDILIASFSSGTSLNCLDGGTGNFLVNIPTNDYRTYGIVSLGDIDGDGVDDFTGGDQSGRLYIYSPGTDSMIYTQDFPERITTLEVLSSIDGDNYPEILVGLDNGYVSCISTNLSGVGVEELPPVTEGQFRLLGNFPDPFISNTQIRFVLGSSDQVTVKIYNTAGQLVLTPVDQKQYSAGLHQIDIDCEFLSSGVYFYRLITSNQSSHDRLLIVR
ncbi:MAG: choice-of-anchor D domain-containing protein [bacterium]